MLHCQTTNSIKSSTKKQQSRSQHHLLNEQQSTYTTSIGTIGQQMSEKSMKSKLCMIWLEKVQVLELSLDQGISEAQMIPAHGSAQRASLSRNTAAYAV